MRHDDRDITFILEFYKLWLWKVIQQCDGNTIATMNFLDTEFVTAKAGHDRTVE